MSEEPEKFKELTELQKHLSALLSSQPKEETKVYCRKVLDCIRSLTKLTDYMPESLKQAFHNPALSEVCCESSKIANVSKTHSVSCYIDKK